MAPRATHPQVTTEIMGMAKPGAVFMNCLPAMRGEEQTAEVRCANLDRLAIKVESDQCQDRSRVMRVHARRQVIDGPQSVVFEQAENRLHAQKALLYLLITRQL
jgi:ornithine carbamoyltransferase